MLLRAKSCKAYILFYFEVLLLCFLFCSKLACYGHLYLKHFFQPSQNFFWEVGKLAIEIEGRGQTSSKLEAYQIFCWRRPNPQLPAHFEWAICYLATKQSYYKRLLHSFLTICCWLYAEYSLWFVWLSQLN